MVNRKDGILTILSIAPPHGIPIYRMAVLNIGTICSVFYFDVKDQPFLENLIRL
jgi:hypothetical protein